MTEGGQSVSELRKTVHLLRSALDGNGDTVFVKDLHGKYLYMNEAGGRRFDRPVPEILGNDATAIFDPESARRLIELDRQVMESGEPQTSDRTLRLLDGTIKVFAASRTPFRDENGKIIGLIGVSRDVTSQKQAQEALRASEERYRVFVDHATDALFLHDEKGIVLDVNRQACQSLGYSREELIGMDPASFDPDLTPERRKMISEGLAGGGTVSLDSRHRRKDGSTFPVEVRVRALVVNEQRFIMALVRDISSRKAAEEALRHGEETANQHRIEIAHLSRVASVGEMASSLAHELNQPLTAILSYAGVCMDAARSGKPAREMAEHLQELCKEANRAAEIIRRVRVFIRRQTPQRRVQDVRPRLEEAVDLMRFELQRAGIRPQYEFSRDLPEVEIDSVQIQQVLINLMQNALDAMDGLEKDQRKLILKTDNADAGGVRVCVIDAGIGVPGDVSTKIFESFFTTKRNGLGLGLPICRSIIESHGGHLSAVANPDRGMTFEFVLPAAGRA